MKTVLIDQKLKCKDPFKASASAPEFLVRLGRLYEGMEYFMAHTGALLKDKYALHRFIKLRQRDILTKENRLRFRYVAGSSVVYLALIAASIGSLSGTLSMDGAVGSARHASQVMQIVSGFSQTADQDQAQQRELAANTLQSHVSDSIRKASTAIQKPPKPLHREVKIGRGDTVAGVLQEAGLGGTEAYYAVKALSKHYDPRKIKPGQKLQVHFKPGGPDDGLIFNKMTMKLDPVKTVVVIRDNEDNFASVLDEKELKPHSNARFAEIETSLYGSAARAGIPPQVIAEVIRIYSWDIDFQRDIRRGDKIEVLYETQETDDGDFARYGDVLYANLSVGGKDIPIYRYEMKDGRVDYFEPDGFSIRKTLMKTPVDGARISSSFGMRKHPVLGYNKMHKGMDFSAPTGTPIYAAGDGVIDFIGRKGAYGNYVRVRHNSKLKTAYAHMHKFGRGMTKGKRVEQGQVIGYVGTTGRSTGPHLHYEVHMDGKQVNPKSVDLPTGEQLDGDELKRFKGLMGAVYQQYVALSDGLKFAQKNSGKKSGSGKADES